MGTVILRHASGIFPDGTPFHIPQSDAIPAVREPYRRIIPTHARYPFSLPGDDRAQNRVDGNCALSRLIPRDSRYFAERRNFDTMKPSGETDASSPSAARTFACCWNPSSPITWWRCATTRGPLSDKVQGHFIFDPEFVPP